MKHVALFIGLNPDRKILLQHKTADAPNNANLWVLFGGSLEEGEEPEKAIQRELWEELKIKMEPLFLRLIHMRNRGAQWNEIFFMGM